MFSTQKLAAGLLVGAVSAASLSAADETTIKVIDKSTGAAISNVELEVVTHARVPFLDDTGWRLLVEKEAKYQTTPADGEVVIMNYAYNANYADYYSDIVQIRAAKDGYKLGYHYVTSYDGVPTTNGDMPASITIKLEKAGAVSDVKWAGMRASQYGATLTDNHSLIDNEGTDWSNAHMVPYPAASEWSSMASTMANTYSNADPIVVLIIGELDENKSDCKLFFKPDHMSYLSDWANATQIVKENNSSEKYDHIYCSPPYKIDWDFPVFEEYMDAYLASGTKVWLQVEPGKADVSELMKLTMNKFHTKYNDIIVGFGVDVEFYDYEFKASKGYLYNSVVSNEKALEWELLLKSYDPDYKLFLKHFFPSDMPDTYRGDIVFVDDIQDMGSMSNYLYNTGEGITDEGLGMLDWAKEFSPNPVIHQTGYLADWNYNGSNSGYNPSGTAKAPWYETQFSTDPAMIYSGLTSQLINGSEPEQDVGIVWVDFTMRDLHPDAFTNAPVMAAPVWVPNTEYSAGAEVRYNNTTWEARNWTANEVPSQTTVWQSRPAGTDVSLWQNGESYDAGKKVFWNGFTWSAKWWTRGEEPGTGTSGVWKQLSNGFRNWDASQIFDAGDLASHNGKVWVAKWWTQGEEPGVANVWVEKNE